MFWAFLPMWNLQIWSVSEKDIRSKPKHEDQVDLRLYTGPSCECVVDSPGWIPASLPVTAGVFIRRCTVTPYAHYWEITVNTYYCNWYPLWPLKKNKQKFIIRISLWLCLMGTSWLYTYRTVGIHHFQQITDGLAIGKYFIRVEMVRAHVLSPSMFTLNISAWLIY